MAQDIRPSRKMLDAARQIMILDTIPFLSPFICDDPGRDTASWDLPGGSARAANGKRYSISSREALPFLMKTL